MFFFSSSLFFVPIDKLGIFKLFFEGLLFSSHLWITDNLKSNFRKSRKSFDSIKAVRTEYAPSKRSSEHAAQYQDRASYGWVYSLERSLRFLEIRWCGRRRSPSPSPKRGRLWIHPRIAFHRSERRFHSHETSPAWTRLHTWEVNEWSVGSDSNAHSFILRAIGKVHDSQSTADAVGEGSILNGRDARVKTQSSFIAHRGVSSKEKLISYHIECHLAVTNVPFRAFVLSCSSHRCSVCHHHNENRQSSRFPFPLQKHKWFITCQTQQKSPLSAQTLHRRCQNWKLEFVQREIEQKAGKLVWLPLIELCAVELDWNFHFHFCFSTFSHRARFTRFRGFSLNKT